VTATVADFVTIGSGPDALSSDVPGLDESSALVAAARAGDRAAFGRLVDLHEASALRTAAAALGRREDAEDVVQEAFVVAWRRLPGFRGEAAFRTWFLTIVWRRALDRRKARDRWWRKGSSSSPDDGDLARDETGRANPEQLAIDRQHRRAIAQAIARLSPKLRDALLLAASGEHTYEDIARLLGTREGTVKWRVFEARRIVRTSVAARTLDRKRE
jgi:RNA polymerase sigma-70 factor (ECF subfamily)